MAREFGYFANVFSHLVPEIIAVFAGIFIRVSVPGAFSDKKVYRAGGNAGRKSRLTVQKI
ncbi:MAG: hypothetical protein V8R80_09470 [Eubacterium sp.]